MYPDIPLILISATSFSHLLTNADMPCSYPFKSCCKGHFLRLLLWPYHSSFCIPLFGSVLCYYTNHKHLPWTSRIYPQPTCLFSINTKLLAPTLINYDVSFLLQFIRYPTMSQLPINILRQFSVYRSLLKPFFFFFPWYLQKTITFLLLLQDPFG